MMRLLHLCRRIVKGDGNRVKEDLLVPNEVTGFAFTFGTAMFHTPVFSRHLVKAFDVFQLMVDSCR